MIQTQWERHEVTVWDVKRCTVDLWPLLWVRLYVSSAVNAARCDPACDLCVLVCVRIQVIVTCWSGQRVNVCCLAASVFDPRVDFSGAGEESDSSERGKCWLLSAVCFDRGRCDTHTRLSAKVCVCVVSVHHLVIKVNLRKVDFTFFSAANMLWMKYEREVLLLLCLWSAFRTERTWRLSYWPPHTLNQTLSYSSVSPWSLINPSGSALTQTSDLRRLWVFYSEGAQEILPDLWVPEDQQSKKRVTP